MTTKALGIAWYRKADYDRLRSIFTDGANLPESFEQWEKSAEKLHQRCLAQGNIVVKAYIDPDTFPAWCSAQGLGVDANGRMRFANTVAHDYAVKAHAQDNR